MRNKYHYEWVAYAENLKYGRLPIARGRNLKETRREASASGKGAYIIRKERVYDTEDNETTPVYEITLVRRKVADGDGRPIINSQLATRYLMEHCYDISEMWREKAFAIFLDKARRPLGHTLVSTGGLDSTVIDIRLMARCALDTLAAGVILSHNHPSGNPNPGPGDVEQTKRLKTALSTLGIELVDHIVMTPESYFAFSEDTLTKIRQEKPLRKAS